MPRKRPQWVDDDDGGDEAGGVGGGDRRGERAMAPRSRSVGAHEHHRRHSHHHHHHGDRHVKFEQHDRPRANSHHHHHHRHHHHKHKHKHSEGHRRRETHGAKHAKPGKKTRKASKVAPMHEETSFSNLPENDEMEARNSLGAMILSAMNEPDPEAGTGVSVSPTAGTHYYPQSDLPSVESSLSRGAAAAASNRDHHDANDRDEMFEPEDLIPTFTLRRRRRESKRRQSRSRARATEELDLEQYGNGGGGAEGPRPGRGARYGRGDVDPQSLQPLSSILMQGIHDIGDTLRRHRRSRQLNPMPASQSRRPQPLAELREEDEEEEDAHRRRSKDKERAGKKNRKEKGKKGDKDTNKNKKKKKGKGKGSKRDRRSSRFSLSGLTGTLKRKMKIVKGRQKLESLSVHRPFFTWWASVTQIAVIVMVLLLYDRAPTDFVAMTKSTKPLLQPDQTYRVLRYEVTSNFWFGPKHEDLVVLGAKYLPCMSKDSYVTNNFIQPQLDREKEMGCCINSGVCWSSLEEDCQHTFDGSEMCGGPSCCVNPDAFPGCERREDVAPSERTCTCSIQARPCCYGLAGQCTLTTKETCESEALRGVFHANKTSCRQVNCLDDKCGLSPFASSTPDQWYRFFLAIFLHSGAIHLFVVLLLQFSLVPDVERIAGWWRVGLIYFVSGAGGFVISGLFAPYQVTVGASGANFGILAALIVELVQAWKYVDQPGQELTKLLVVVILALGIGILPYVDNYSHIGGFAFGIVSAVAFLPYITFGSFDKARKRLLSLVALGCIVAAFVILFTVFYATTVPNCSFCGYINCVDLLEDFCANHAQASDEPLYVDYP